MELNLYIKEGEQLKLLKVPAYVVKNLLKDRLSQSELDRINRFCVPIEKPNFFSAGSVVVDFSNKTAKCFQAGLKIEYLEPTWDVKVETMSLNNY